MTGPCAVAQGVMVPASSSTESSQVQIPRCGRASTGQRRAAPRLDGWLRSGQVGLVVPGSFAQSRAVARCRCAEADVRPSHGSPYCQSDLTWTCPGRLVCACAAKVCAGAGKRGPARLSARVHGCGKGKRSPARTTSPSSALMGRALPVPAHRRVQGGFKWSVHDGFVEGV
jgi:hypothetical protein